MSLTPAGPPGPPPLPSVPPGSGPAGDPELRRSVLDLIGPVRKMREELERLRGRVARQEERIARQDEQLDLMRQALQRVRQDTTTEKDAAHHEAAAWYTDVRRRIDELAGSAARTVYGERPAAERHEAHARLTSALCRLAFAAQPSSPQEWRLAAGGITGDPDALPDVGRAWQEVSALRFRVGRLGGVHRWDFEVPAGRPHDPDVYDLWHKSDPGLPVSHVVAPAYQVVGRTVHVRAWVHTARG
ncbi:hypothetical protein [Streptomyces genisteinicus]|uniref:Uncharacterized protein n=1 Tax=Streptomyces genisteinicus TaxID=2768068 RepID=A0A7H0I037_9ACTN|nr:hypothetical protein [Streptomyces genisteinicus]QNP66153.1 hypothetical protein IAG43_26645 [Streptomyces genisteinicus]